jgi:hypothetical protein
MRHLVMVRRVLARRPWIYWTIVAAVAAGAAIATASVLGGVDDERARWGETAVVVVTTRDVTAGEPLAGLITEHRYPIAMIPPGAVSSLEAGVAARHRLGAGEIVVDVDVAATTAPRSLTPHGWLAVAVIEGVASGAIVGDHVVVASEGVRLADDALIVGHRDGVTIVAVPDDEAPMVAAASGSTAGVALLLRP